MCRVRLWKWGDTVGDLTTGTRRPALGTSILCDHPHHHYCQQINNRDKEVRAWEQPTLHLDSLYQIQTFAEVSEYKRCAGEKCQEYVLRKDMMGLMACRLVAVCTAVERGRGSGEPSSHLPPPTISHPALRSTLLCQTLYNLPRAEQRGSLAALSALRWVVQSLPVQSRGAPSLAGRD